MASSIKAITAAGNRVRASVPYGVERPVELTGEATCTVPSRMSCTVGDFKPNGFSLPTVTRPLEAQICWNAVPYLASVTMSLYSRFR
jgi:hypothetical protein